MRALPVFALLLALALPAGAGQSVMELAGEAFGTRWSVRIVPGAGEPSPALLAREIRSALGAVDAELSTWRGDSELSRFNRSRETGWWPVSHHTARVVEETLRVHRLSAGALDPTVAPLLEVWGFGPAPRRLTPPPPEAVREARARVGADALEVRRQPPALRKARPEVSVDLSATAKGFAVDRVAGVLDEAGVRRFLVEIGGELRARGAGPTGGPWPVEIERPGAALRSAIWTVGLDDAALATSGGHRDAFEWRGRRYPHVLDPRTGRPVEHPLASVSVLAPEALAADAWATALLVLGPEAGWRVAEREGLAVLFVTEGVAGLEARATAAFERHRLGGAQGSGSRGPESRGPGSRGPGLRGPVSRAAGARGSDPAEREDRMELFAFTFAGFAATFGAMALGVLIGRAPLRRGCGDPGSEACETCTRPCARRRARSDETP